MADSEAGLLRAIDAQTSAVAVMPRAEPHMNAACLAESLAEASGVIGESLDEVLAVARHHLTHALTLAPGNARGWMMLAGSRLRDGDEASVASALAVSFAADPHLPRRAPFRWPMALRLGGQLARGTREQANLEYLSFFRTQPEIAVRIALRQDRLAELTALTSERGEDRRQLERVVRRMQPDGAGA